MGKFVKGNTVGVRFGSGQRGGRPKLIVEVAKAAREYTVEALETLARIMRNEMASSSARVSAAIALLERGHGRAPQVIDVHNHGEVRALSDEQLLVIIGTAAEPSGAGVIEPAPYKGKPH
jgi:hypothetical protein